MLNSVNRLSFGLASCTGVRLFSSNAGAQSIGFIGLGNMGGHMAHNLLKAGHDLVVFDLNATSISTLQRHADSLQRTLRVAKSPANLGESVRTVVTMLPSSPHVVEVYTGKQGLLNTVSAGSLLIDSSTIDPGTTRSVATTAGNKKVIMVDAPVSGGVGGAEAGTLTFMVGSQSVEIFEQVKPILSRMGKNIVHCGGIGTGQVAKVCNNLVLGISMVAVSEGMNLGVKLGMDPSKLAGIFNTSSARCWSSDTYNPVPGVMPNVPSSRGYTGGFGSTLMKKDLGLAISAAESAKLPLPLGQLTNRMYEELIAAGLGEKDFSSMYKFYSEKK